MPALQRQLLGLQASNDDIPRSFEITQKLRDRDSDFAKFSIEVEVASLKQSL